MLTEWSKENETEIVLLLALAAILLIKFQIF